MKHSSSNKLTVFTCLLGFIAFGAQAQQKELRGVWYTPRIGGSIATKAQIAAVMDTIANNNFNTVYVLGWSRGWPLFRSGVFYEYTGYWTDPAAGTRDVLQEMIAEAHRRGLEIEAWMEYGFVGWYSPPGDTSTGPLFNRFPDWMGRDGLGNFRLPLGDGSGSFIWLNHNHPDARRFLLRLHKEIAERYDIDGIELDRIRYPGLNFGYDEYTKSLYRSENNGSDPPVNVNDSAWMRWRADKINSWHREVYDSIKAVSPYALVTNAPSHYGSGNVYPAYTSFLQDWKQWINTGSVDNVQVQMYIAPASLGGYLRSAVLNIVPEKKSKVYAGLSVTADNIPFTIGQIYEMIDSVRNQQWPGMSFWYYNNLLQLKTGNNSYFTQLKIDYFRSKVVPPYRNVIWRPQPLVINDSTASGGAGWVRYGYYPAYNHSMRYADVSVQDTLTYFAETETSGYYELYIYVPPYHPIQGKNYSSYSTNARYILLTDESFLDTVTVDQMSISSTINQGWLKLGDVYVRAGAPRKVLQLVTAGNPTTSAVIADDIMLILNRRLSPEVVVSVNSRGDYREAVTPSRFQMNVFPNPFNGTTTVEFALAKRGDVRLELYDSLGRKITSVYEGIREAGVHRQRIDGAGLASGVYFIRCFADNRVSTAVISHIK